MAGQNIITGLPRQSYPVDRPIAYDDASVLPVSQPLPEHIIYEAVGDTNIMEVCQICCLTGYTIADRKGAKFSFERNMYTWPLTD